MKFQTTLQVRISISQLAAAPLLAQGPKPLGLRQPAPTVAAHTRQTGTAASADTTHVRPNHWKRGATIGALAGMTPAAVWMLSTESGGGDKGFCIWIGFSGLALLGLLGALTGGLIGSFFSR